MSELVVTPQTDLGLEQLRLPVVDFWGLPSQLAGCSVVLIAQGYPPNENRKECVGRVHLRRNVVTRVFVIKEKKGKKN